MTLRVQGPDQALFEQAVAKEVEPFGIRLTLVEPGPTGTNFGAGLVKADPLPAYDETPVGELRRARNHLKTLNPFGEGQL
jgi:NAD(P)-dependent dehydrogenase (short-subunit alcohol dehydrogenase family)